MQPVRERRPVRRVLLVAPNWLGDVIMTLPALEWLATARRAAGAPAITLSLAIRSAWAPLLVGDARVDELLVTERPGRHAGWAGAARQAAQWRAGGFDAALLGPPSLRAALVAGAAGIPLRVGHRGDLRGPLLTLPLPRLRRGARHFSEEMLDLARALARDCGWPQAAQRSADAAGWAPLAPALVVDKRPAAGDRPLWALGAGATFGPAKTWPAPRAGEFMRSVTASGGRVLVMGDAAAAPLVAALRAATDGLSWAQGEAAVTAEPTADVIDLTGRTDLAAVVGWLRASRAFVGNDSGLMHLAAALGVPTVGLFGSSNPDWTRPLGPRTLALAADGFDCRPCYRRTCNRSEFCLDTLDGRRVHAAALALAEQGHAPGVGPRGGDGR